MTAGIRLAVFLIVMQCIVTGPTAAAPPADAESLFGPADLAAIAGRGRLTLGVNRSGRLTTCRWPSPGYYEHITYATRSRSEPLLGVEPWHGAGWALQLGDQLVWSHDDRWSHRLISTSSPGVIEIDSVLEGQDVRMRQLFSVAQDGNAFVTRVTVIGAFDEAPGAFWYANFSPSTRLIPHLPIATNVVDDFASFVDPNLNAICHFRPRDPSAGLWRKARGLEDSTRSSEDWTAFPAGSYVVYGTANAVKGMSVGPEQGPASVATQVSAGTLSEQRSATGQVASAIAIELSPQDDGYTATVVTAFGTNYAAAAQRYVAAQENAIETPTESAVATESDAERVMRHAMSTIRTCTDAETGSVVRSPTNTPPLAIDWPRYGIWISIAYDAAGDRESARRILAFYADHVRIQAGDNVPPGSIPAALYTNGVEAAPEAMVDAAAAGRVLWAIYQHASLLSAPEMRSFYRSVWEGVDAMADFLVQWREPGGTAPLYTFDYELLRDRRTTELYVASYLGVHNANRIANFMRELRPDWQQAAGELRAALRLHAMQADGEIAIANPGALYDTGIGPGAFLFDWPSAIRGMLRDSTGRLDTVALENLCKLVLSSRDIPEELQMEIASQLIRHLDRGTPDAADAAFAYLIAHRLHSIALSPPVPIEQLTPGTL